MATISSSLLDQNWLLSGLRQGTVYLYTVYRIPELILPLIHVCHWNLASSDFFVLGTSAMIQGEVYPKHWDIEKPCKASIVCSFSSQPAQCHNCHMFVCNWVSQPPRSPLFGDQIAMPSNMFDFPVQDVMMLLNDKLTWFFISHIQPHNIT